MNSRINTGELNNRRLRKGRSNGPASANERLRGSHNPGAGGREEVSIGPLSHQTYPTVITRRSDPPCTMVLVHPHLDVARVTVSTRHGTHRVKVEVLGERWAHLFQPTGRCLGSLLAERQNRRYRQHHHPSPIAATGAWETCVVQQSNTQPRYSLVSVDLRRRSPWCGQQRPVPLRSLLNPMVCKRPSDHMAPMEP